MDRVLPTHYFHVVFTLPHELGPLALRNRKVIFDMLFSAAARTLLELGMDEQRLGAQLGVTAVLHTWSRDLRFHPHVHCIVTGGGLASTGDRWISAPQKYLFPVRVLSALFRGKFLSALTHAYERDELDLEGACAVLADGAQFDRLKDVLYRKDWVVYAKRPFAGPEQVFKYLAQYTHRVGISDHRIVSFDARGVCFRTKDGKHVTVSPEEFIRRFLLHVLPDSFVKIRHYGILASGNVRTKRADARRHLKGAVETDDPRTPEQTWQERLLALTGIDLALCPRCAGAMVRRPLEPDPLQASPAASWSPPAFADTS